VWLLLALAIAASAAGWFVLRKRGDLPSAAGQPASLGTSTSNAASASSESEQAKAQAPGDGAIEGALSTKNRSDRSGAYFIPAGSHLPLMVALHGTGGDGASLLRALKHLAQRRNFAIVAPDSGFIPEAGAHTWYVARQRGDPSSDSPHIAQTIEEVVGLAGGRIAPNGWIAVGHSGGASSAPYLATHDLRFAAFGVLHGGAFPDAFGPLHPRGWFSTGNADPARPPDHVREQARNARRVLGAGPLDVHIYSGGHELIAEELEGLIHFWLDSAPVPKAP